MRAAHGSSLFHAWYRVGREEHRMRIRPLPVAERPAPPGRLHPLTEAGAQHLFVGARTRTNVVEAPTKKGRLVKAIDSDVIRSGPV